MSLALTQEQIDFIANNLDATVFLKDLTVVEHVPLSQVADEVLEKAVVEEGGLTDPVGQIISWLADQLSWVVESIVSAVDTLLSPIGLNVETILTTVISLGDTIVGTANTIIENLGDYVSELISSALTTILSTIDTAVTSFVSSLDYVLNEVLGIKIDLLNAFNTLKESFRVNILDPILNLITNLPSMVADILTDISDYAWNKIIRPLLDALIEGKNVVATIVDIANTVIRDLQEGYVRIMETATAWLIERLEGIVTFLYDVRTVLSQLTTEVIDALSTLPERLPEIVTRMVAKAEEWVWEHLPDWAKKFLQEAPKSLNSVAVTFQGFVNAVLKFWEETPIWLKPIISPLATIVDFALKPDEYIRNIGKSVWEFLTSEFSAMLSLAMPVVGGLLKLVVSGFKDLSKVVLTTLQEAYTLLVNVAKPMIKKFTLAITQPIGDLLTPMGDAIDSVLKNTIKTIVEKGGEWKNLVFAIAVLHLAILVPVVLPRLLGALAHAISEIRAQLSAFGFGGLTLVLSGRPFYELSKIVSHVPYELSRAFIWSFGLVASEPFRYVTRVGVKRTLSGLGLGNIPIDIPAMAYIIRQCRMKGLVETADTVREILYFRGLPDWFVDAVTKGVEIPKEVADIVSKKVQGEFIVITDRFGNARLVPTSMLFFYPTESDLTRFMIRDMFKEGEEYPNYATWGYRLGLHPDIAFFYYLLHFRYPPPERLWEFTSRGISGLLWYTLTEKGKELVTEEIKWTKAFEPKSPSELNFQYSKLLEMLERYMKWHDYARFSWAQGFTSDNMIMIDTLADIPTKIDQRWMVKWALYELMKEKGIEFSAPIRDIAKKVLEPRAVSPKIQMDLTFFCRTLQATGLHPDWIPITAVAETINALSDERTLLRTGFLNLYKEGFWTLKDIDELLKGFFHASFKVAHFDMDAKNWVIRWLNVPVRFLPAERKLLELRGVFDRALDLLRDYSRAIYTGIRDLILEPTEAIQSIKNFVTLMNTEWFKAEVKEITDKEKELTVDEKWIKLYTKYAEQLREIYKIVRARYYARYLFWRLIYRFERGFITKDEIKTIIGNIVDKIKESPLVKELLEDVAETMADAYERNVKADAVISKFSRGILKYQQALNQLIALGLSSEVASALLEAKVKLYVPTVLTIATLSELVPEAVELLPEVFEIRGIPAHHRPYWEKYIKRKPLADDFGYVRTAIRGALREGVDITQIDVQAVFREADKIWAKVSKWMAEFGIINEEFRLWYLEAYIKQLTDIIKGKKDTWVPTVSEMATISEVVPEVRKELDYVFEKRNIDERFRDYLRKYVKLAPWRDELRRVVTETITAYADGTIDENIFNQILSELKKYGYEDEEIEFIKFVAKLRKLRYGRRYRGG
ncbi:MAG: hypothetical protein DRO23_08020 [Thermoprotei archaeon]|nr:MAG: hypothetical protein DRO23_08020 [Thermoprotei archaeon]